MTIRVAKNNLTGRTPLLEPDIVLGRREGGQRGVTVRLPHDYNYVCFDNPWDMDHFIKDLMVAHKYLSESDRTVL